MHNAAAVSDMKQNGFLMRPLTKKEIAKGKQGLLHDLPEELKVSLVLAAIEDAPETHKANLASIDRQTEMRREKEMAGLDKDTEALEQDYIEALIYHKMANLEVCWKTAREVDEGLRRLKYKKDKIGQLKDNILIRVKGFGWLE